MAFNFAKFGVLLWISIENKGIYLYIISLIMIFLYLGLFIRVAIVKPYSKCWLIVLYVLDILSLIFGILFITIEVVAAVEIFDSLHSVTKVFIVISWILHTLEIILIILSIVFSSQLLCCPGHGSHFYLLTNSPNQNVLSQINTGNTLQSFSGKRNYYPKEPTDTKPILTI